MVETKKSSYIEIESSVRSTIVRGRERFLDWWQEFKWEMGLIPRFVGTDDGLVSTYFRSRSHELRHHQKVKREIEARFARLGIDYISDDTRPEILNEHPRPKILDRK